MITIKVTEKDIAYCHEQECPISVALNKYMKEPLVVIFDEKILKICRPRSPDPYVVWEVEHSLEIQMRIFLFAYRERQHPFAEPFSFDVDIPAKYLKEQILQDVIDVRKGFK